MTCCDLHGLVETVFRSKGSTVLTSSRENRYLLLSKDGTRTAVSYGALGAPPTEGELEMFVSMAQNDSALRMVFLAPVLPGAEARAVIRRENMTVWDRTALTLALGEAVIHCCGTPEVSARPTAPVALPGQPPPRTGRATVEPLDIRSMIGVPPKGTSMSDNEHPLPGPVEAGNVPEGGIEASLKGAMEALGDLSSFMGIEGPTSLPTRTEAPSNVMPDPGPWHDFRLAPVKLGPEEACTRAGAQVDPRPELVLRPHLMLDVRYTLRSGQLEPLERTKSLIVDMREGRPQDIPPTISSELCSISEKWERGAADGPRVSEGADPSMDGAKAVLGTLSSEKVTQDRLVRDSLMSTIYQEATYTLDPSSFEVLRTEKVMLPFWVRRSREGAEGWSVDAFLGRFFPGT